MCYGMDCPYENRNGDCTKPRHEPCHYDEKALEEYEFETMLAWEAQQYDDAIAHAQARS